MIWRGKARRNKDIIALARAQAGYIRTVHARGTARKSRARKRWIYYRYCNCRARSGVQSAFGCTHTYTPFPRLCLSTRYNTLLRAQRIVVAKCFFLYLDPLARVLIWPRGYLFYWGEPMDLWSVPIFVSIQLSTIKLVYRFWVWFISALYVTMFISTHSTLIRHRDLQLSEVSQTRKLYTIPKITPTHT